MNKFKQNLYTVLLIGTCLVASPFIFHRIWKTSADAKKNFDVPPPPVVTNSVASPAEKDNPPEVPHETSASSDNVQTSETIPASVPAEPVTDAEPAFVLNNDFVQSELSYFDDALFIGDSRTVGIKEYGTFVNSDFFCSVGLAASNIESEYVNGTNFDSVIKNKQYGKVYIMLGINEVGNDFEFTMNEYRKIVEKVRTNQPNAIIYIQGNLHVAYSAETTAINNERINYLNSRLSTLADNSKIFYIDINEVYDDSSGYLTESYTSDGIHPLARYYMQWCDWLCTKTIIPVT
ncbi:MAG: hypothetical protein K2I00_06835 [Ruminococcus sp.]|nr:hypothetical protein [Ruminococcus sp.]